MKITLLDTETLKKVEFEVYDDWQTIWQWTEGNFGCDCNRAFQFSEELDGDVYFSAIEETDKVKIIEIEQQT